MSRLLVVGLALTACGGARVVGPDAPQLTAGCGERLTCTGGGRVGVQTGLAPGTELSAAECDEVCASVMCAVEPKRCHVEAAPLGGRSVLCRPALEPTDSRCPIF